MESRLEETWFLIGSISTKADGPHSGLFQSHTSLYGASADIKARVIWQISKILPNDMNGILLLDLSVIVEMNSIFHGIIRIYII